MEPSHVLRHGRTEQRTGPLLMADETGQGEESSITPKLQVCEKRGAGIRSS